MISKTVYDSNCLGHSLVIKSGYTGYFIYLDDTLVGNFGTIEEADYFTDKCLQSKGYHYLWEIL